jgi:uncharacterized membrane protein YfhO
VDPDPESRVTALGAGTLPPDEVVLDRPPPTKPAGQPATITVTEDGTDNLAARIEASGAGYLVIADALQHGWTATLNGKPTPLLPADHGLAAIAVPAGTHTVRLEYQMPLHNAGAWISAAALMALTVTALYRRRGLRKWRLHRRR